jgi:hypothetical protein
MIPATTACVTGCIFFENRIFAKPAIWVKFVGWLDGLRVFSCRDLIFFLKKHPNFQIVKVIEKKKNVESIVRVRVAYFFEKASSEKI